MGYVAVTGGRSAIEASIKRLTYERLRGGRIIEVESIESGMGALIDQIMSESSLYSRRLAAIAIKQAQGNPEEAVFLMRAYRSTLPRKHYSQVVQSTDMRIERRISAAFKDIPGGQILGASYDYSHRLINFDLEQENVSECLAWLQAYESEEETNQPISDQMPKVLDYLRDQSLLEDCQSSDEEPGDVTQKSISFPAHRSERLQVLTRGQTGAVTSFAYSSIRGYGSTHPTIGELRVGYLPVFIEDPLEIEDQDEAIFIGEIKVTEVETIFPTTMEDEQGEKTRSFELGYGICYGQNETKAIAMSILDYNLQHPDPTFPSHHEEFVLLHIDSVESTGFISHLKLPHYVTFSSELDRMVNQKRGKDQ